MRLWVFIFGVVVLAGCARFESKPVSPAATATQFEQRALNNPSLKSFLERKLHRTPADWPATEWDFEMLAFAAFYYHPSLEVVRAQWRVTQAGITTAGARPNPTLSAGPGYNISAASGVNPWLPFGTLDVPIETAGKRGYRVAQAQHLSEAARLNIVTTAWQVRAVLRSSLLNSVAAQRREELLRRQMALQQEIGDKLEKQLQAGVIASAEIVAARISLAKTQAELAGAQRQLAEARVGVADATGIPASALEGISLKFDLAQTPPADALTSTDARRMALKGRTDILGALAEYAASQSALQLEIAKQYPDVHLAPGYQWDQGESKWQLGLTAELPILSHNQGPVAEAEARRAESAARFVALQARIVGEIDRALAVYQACRKNLSAMQSLSAAQQQQRENAEAQLKAGAADSLDWLGAQLEFNTATLGEFDALVKLHEAIGALEDALQQPLAAVPPDTIQALSR